MKYIPAGLTKKLYSQILSVKKTSPRTLFIAGVAGTVVSTVLACRATLKLEGTLANTETKIHDLKTFKDQTEDKVYRHDMAYIYAKGTLDIIKLYAPAVIVGGLSIGALTGSHVTLSRRNAGLTAAYSAVSASFEAYRDRVRAALGEEKELDIYHAAEIEKIKEDGKTLTQKVVDPNKWSPYAKIFDESNIHWQKNPEFNRIFIQAKQNYLNHLLQSRGHLFLNEAYEELGFDHTAAGAVVGWVIGKDGDNFIDFGMFEASSVPFVNGWERSIVLDFNVDGVMWNLI